MRDGPPRQKHGGENERAGSIMIPAEAFAQIPNRKEAEDDERNRFLDDFELDCGIALQRHFHLTLEKGFG